MKSSPKKETEQIREENQIHNQPKCIKHKLPGLDGPYFSFQARHPSVHSNCVTTQPIHKINRPRGHFVNHIMSCNPTIYHGNVMMSNLLDTVLLVANHLEYDSIVQV